MLALQLLASGLVTGCALGVVAISFSLVYATTKIFHVAHAGIYTLGGYLAWAMVVHGAPLLLANAKEAAEVRLLKLMTEEAVSVRVLAVPRSMAMSLDKAPRRLPKPNILALPVPI